MADDHGGMRTEGARPSPQWTKLFTAFRVALDPKKLLLAAVGIVAMSLGWWILSVAFFAMNRTPPSWGQYSDSYPDEPGKAWKAFRDARNRWNLLYKMAGPVPATLADAQKFDAADEASSAEEYQQIEKEVAKIKDEIGLQAAEVKVDFDQKEHLTNLQVGDYKIRFDPPPGETKRETLYKALKQHKLTAPALAASKFDQKSKILTVGGTPILLSEPEQWEKFKNDFDLSRPLSAIEQEIWEGRRKPEAVAKKALRLVQEEKTKFKPSGQIRTWPWGEYRGPNPYLMITGRAGELSGEGVRALPWEQGHFIDWLLGDEVPVLLEPLVKFLRPVLYMLLPAAGGWNRIYLFLVILWGLAVWAVIGGAITRMAAIQVARNNEKIGMTEAVRFAWARFQSYLSAPLLPLVFIAILAAFLWLYGLVGAWTWFVGDIIIAGLMLPLALILGLIIAVVLVGLVGWPLMYATISTEGSDSFDAISRSYSYVYQAPWHYLWYGLVSLGYGAVLIFFVGLMGSLIAYTTKWGMSLAPTLEKREPTYLFAFAPESFGWRDLLLYQSPNVKIEPVVRPNGLVARERQLKDEPNYEFTLINRLGAYLVAFWLGILFLFVVGFGYSYFWTASTIIYLLMRRKVDDTDLDEIHLEEETEEPYVPPAPAAPPPASKPGVTPLTMVEPPILKSSPTPVSPEPVRSADVAVVPPPAVEEAAAPVSESAPPPAEPSPTAGTIPPPAEPPPHPPEGGPDRGPE
jgi:hypothetical protein